MRKKGEKNGGIKKGRRRQKRQSFPLLPPPTGLMLKRIAVLSNVLINCYSITRVLFLALSPLDTEKKI